jgi:ADP-ribose pyrophosphatase YjhB (NUDIX family)
MHAHRHVGVYGVCVSANQLLVINKNTGPYRNRYDLPGGRLAPDESLAAALTREFDEEVGMTPTIVTLIGARDFFVRWVRGDYTHEHHIALFYAVSVEGAPQRAVREFDGQDSLGCSWVSTDALSLNNASPLVLQAVQWLTTGVLPTDPQRYDDWRILD